MLPACTLEFWPAPALAGRGGRVSLVFVGGHSRCRPCSRTAPGVTSAPVWGWDLPVGGGMIYGVRRAVEPQLGSAQASSFPGHVAVIESSALPVGVFNGWSRPRRTRRTVGLMFFMDAAPRPAARMRLLATPACSVFLLGETAAAMARTALRGLLCTWPRGHSALFDSGSATPRCRPIAFDGGLSHPDRRPPCVTARRDRGLRPCVELGPLVVRAVRADLDLPVVEFGAGRPLVGKMLRATGAGAATAQCSPRRRRGLAQARTDYLEPHGTRSLCSSTKLYFLVHGGSFWSTASGRRRASPHDHEAGPVECIDYPLTTTASTFVRMLECS